MVLFLPFYHIENFLLYTDPGRSIYLKSVVLYELVQYGFDPLELIVSCAVKEVCNCDYAIAYKAGILATNLEFLNLLLLLSKMQWIDQKNWVVTLAQIQLHLLGLGLANLSWRHFYGLLVLCIMAEDLLHNQAP